MARRVLIGFIATCVLSVVAVPVAQASFMSDAYRLAKKVARGYGQTIDADEYAVDCRRSGTYSAKCRIKFYGGSVGYCYLLIRIEEYDDGYLRSEGIGGSC
jgi:hypothetical protein